MRPMSLKTTSSQTANITDLFHMEVPPPFYGRFRGNDRDDFDQNLLVLEAVVIDN